MNEISIKSKKEPIALYGRVSTRAQKLKETIKNQKIALEKYVKDNNLNVYDSYYDDGVTSDLSLNDRPEGFRLLKDAKNGKFKKIIILKADRFGRDTADSLYTRKKLEQYGVTLSGVLENIDDDLIFTIYQAVAQREKKDILLRSRLGRERAISEGRWVDGNPPYGFIINSETKKLKIFEPETEIIRRIYELCTIHRFSCPKIAEILNREKVPPYTKGKNKKIHRENVRGKTVENAKFWWSARIIHILRDPTYKGKKVLGKKSKDKKIRILEVEPIASEKIWNLAQKVLRTNRVESIRNRKRSYPLSGIVYCGKCNRRYSGLASHGVLYYGCNGYRLISSSSPEKCFNKNVRAKEVEQTVWQDVKDFIKNPQQIRKFLLESQKKLTKIDYVVEIEKVEGELKKIEKGIDALLDMDIAEDSLVKKRLEKKLNKLNKEAEKLEETKKQYIKLQQDSVSEQNQMSKIEKNLARFNTIINNPTSEQKKEILKLVVDRIIVYPRKDKEDKRIVKINYKFDKDVCFIAKLDQIG